ncbi:hypothetical protein IKL45_00845 [Candidatus Saccharibacteria bacterium]|nr:hypothetical protein [Candidatus Saccharibacteria bacterium]MBR6122982.1 hypothetical protein [Candidatus Saccharibacteria bacterium]
MVLSNKIKTAVVAVVLAVAGAGAGVLLMPQAAHAQTYEQCIQAAGNDAKKKAQCGMNNTVDDPNSEPTLDGTVKNIINAVLYVVGILAVVMVIIGGVQYTTSGGDSAAVTKAKNTILYGIVGLVIAILAYAIVNFVVGKL